MDADDRKVFQEQYNQTLDLARQAEKVRTGETSLNDALLATGSTSIKKLTEEIESFKALLNKDWSEQIKELKQDILVLNQAVRTTLEKHGKTELELFRTGTPDLVATLSKDLPLAEAKKLTEQITDLHNQWRRITPDNFSEIFFRTQEIPNQIKTLAISFKTTKLENSEVAISSWLAKIQERPAEVSEQIWGEVREQIQTTKSMQNIRTLADELRSLDKFLHEASYILDFVKTGPPSRSNLKPPEVQDVRLDEAPSTNLELIRTPRVADDNITVSARLKIGEKELPSSDATFVVRYFGWHSVLAPSVILTRPNNPRSSFDQNFKFAPAVAWLQKYYPRASDKGKFNAWARFFQMGIGLHVAFLDQNPDKDTEIGLGGAISFWHDRFVAGIGCDLMDNSRGYFYVGSNLIPILQAFGYDREGKTGKQH